MSSATRTFTFRNPDIYAIFNDALERQDGHERVKSLDEACHGRPGVRERVEALLVADSNAGDFLGAAAAHVLLVGATAEREFVRIGELAKAELAWRIGYVFLERAIKTDGGQLAGWNHSYRSLPADDPGWDELADAHGNRPYQSTDFSPLFQFAATS